MVTRYVDLTRKNSKLAIYLRCIEEIFSRQKLSLKFRYESWSYVAMLVRAFLCVQIKKWSSSPLFGKEWTEILWNRKVSLREYSWPFPFCNSINAADLHSEKFPLDWRSTKFLFFCSKEPGESFHDSKLCEYPLGVQGSMKIPFWRDSSTASMETCQN